MQRRTLLAGALAALVMPHHAHAKTYVLGPKGAQISYRFTVGGTPVTGTVPIKRADLSIDMTNLAGARADVTADIRQARTGMLLATEALKSRSILSAAEFPLTRFRSTQVTLGPKGRFSDGARLHGLLTLRGVTRAVGFAAGLYRVQNTDYSDKTRLYVRLDSAIDRRDFGALGYGELVNNTVHIAIRAQIETTT
ncbi:MAG: YceI family protein [Pseudomonadota bacterium]